MKTIICICCLLLVFTSNPLSPEEVERTARFDGLACLDESVVSSIRSTPGILPRVFDLCREELARKTVGELTSSELRLAFAAIAAHSMAPYGNSESASLKDLLADKVMDCDNYVMLASYFMQLLLPTGFSMQFAGFDGGAAGNHAQLFARANDSRTLLLDPTIGLIAIADFNHVLQGKTIPEGQIFVFRQYHDKTIDAFAVKVRKALASGLYKPSDILYVFNSQDDFIAFGERTAITWKTKNIPAIVQNYPTPASRSLSENLHSSWDN